MRHTETGRHIATTQTQTGIHADLAIVNEAIDTVLRDLVCAIRNGEEFSTLVEIENQFDRYVSVRTGVRAGDPDALRKTRTELKEFIQERQARKDLKGLGTDPRAVMPPLRSQCEPR